MKIAILYGSTTGKTEAVAGLLQFYLPGSSVFKVEETTPSDLTAFDTVLVGTSTWGTGVLQDSWNHRLSTFPPDALAGKTLGFFGLGDRVSFSDTFCTAMAHLCARFAPAAARVIGATKERGHPFVGLALDDDNQPLLTEGRVAGWVDQLKNEGL